MNKKNECCEGTRLAGEGDQKCESSRANTSASMGSSSSSSSLQFSSRSSVVMGVVSPGEMCGTNGGAIWRRSSRCQSSVAKNACDLSRWNPSGPHLHERGAGESSGAGC
jgi:hypothetical protein